MKNMCALMLSSSLCSLEVNMLDITSSLRKSPRKLTWSIAVPAYIAVEREASCETSSSRRMQRVLSVHQSRDERVMRQRDEMKW